MILATCERCGRSFGSENDQVLCKRCLEEEIDSDFKKVRDYLYDNPGADINEVEEATKVDKKIILKLLKDDRIEIVDEKNYLLSCEKCGKQIKSGRLCPECKKNNLINELYNVAQDIKEDIYNKEKKEKKEKRSNAAIYHTRKK